MVPSAAAGPGSEHSTFVTLVDFIVYFCDSGILLFSTSVTLIYIYCPLLWLWHTFIVYFSDTSTNFCYTIVTLVVVHIYFLFLWHCYTLILFFCDTGKKKNSSFCHRHIFCFCDTSTYLLSTSVTLIWYTLLSTWHWYTFIFCFCDTCTHLFSSSKDWTAADPTIVKTKELVGLINLLVNSLKSHEDCYINMIFMLETENAENYAQMTQKKEERQREWERTYESSHGHTYLPGKVWLPLLRHPESHDQEKLKWLRTDNTLLNLSWYSISKHWVEQKIWNKDDC